MVSNPLQPPEIVDQKNEISCLLDHLEYLHSDLREEAKLRMEQRDRYIIQQVASLLAVLVFANQFSFEPMATVHFRGNLE